jgi:hypothetical protein
MLDDDMFDLRPAKSISPAAREYYCGRDCARIASAAALLVRSFAASASGNIWLAVKRSELLARYSVQKCKGWDGCVCRVVKVGGHPSATATMNNLATAYPRFACY